MEETAGYPYEELQRDVRELAARFPFFTVSTIGKSLVGRSLPLVIAGEGTKYVLYVGAHHGMEWITARLLMRFLNDYGCAVETDARLFGVSAGFLFHTRRIAVVPMLNPDGVELQIRGRDENNPLSERLQAMSGGDFSRWQANGRGVDLNHNYDAGFEIYKRLEPSLGIYGGGPTRFSGAYPESEPETAALCSFIRRTDVRLLLALHTQGEEIYADYNGYLPPGAALIARRISALCGYTVAEPEKAASYGGLKDWFISAFHRPGFTLECGRGVNPLPERETGAIYERIRGVLTACPSFI